MSDERITLTPKSHEKLDSIRCEVRQEGFVAVGGYKRAIADSVIDYSSKDARRLSR